MDSNEVNRILAVKAALMGMTATQGWRFFKQIADNVVAKAKQVAIDEDDPAKGEVLRQRAKALQDGLRDLFNAVESTKNFEAPDEDEMGILGDLIEF